MIDSTQLKRVLQRVNEASHLDHFQLLGGISQHFIWNFRMLIGLFEQVGQDFIAEFRLEFEQQFVKLVVRQCQKDVF